MNTTDIQREARALGDPTRYRLFRYIVDSEEPVGVAELTAYVQLNHNAVRQHLAVLKEAELVVEELEVRDSPGRPSLLYRLHPEVAGKWETSGAYTWLAGLLGEAMKRDLTSREVGHEEGLQRGERYAGARDADDSVDAMERELIRNGFRPTRSERGRQVDFVLGRCPFEEVAADNPTTVCQLHLGLAEGLAEGLGNVEVDRLTARNPHHAGCRLVIKRKLAPANT
jgi:predicted ArsR family transcriptional regulator